VSAVPNASEDNRAAEMLFIIIHQTKELWFKQIIFEMEQALVGKDALVPACRGVGSD